MRGSNSGYAIGTSGSPQSSIDQASYAAKVAENEGKLKADADDAPLIDSVHIEELERSGVKFTKENVVFTARDGTDQTVWFNKHQEKEDKGKMLDLLARLNGRLDEINDGSFEVEGEETPRVEAL